MRTIKNKIKSETLKNISIDEIKMNEKSYCNENEVLIMQSKYEDLIKDLTNENVIDINLETIRVHEMTCDDFKYGLTSTRIMINLDLQKKRKEFLVKETDSNLTAYRKTDALLNEFEKNLSFLKKIDSLISQHITFIQNGGKK